MKQYILDSNVLIRLLREKEDPLEKRLRKTSPEKVYISAVVLYELYYGAFRSQRAQHNVTLIHDLKFQVLEFDKQDAREAGEIRAYLTKKGTPIGAYDVLIADKPKREAWY